MFSNYFVVFIVYDFSQIFFSTKILKIILGDVFGALVRRISSQIFHVKNIFLTVLGLGAPPSASQKAGLVRDAFGLHKMIVVITETGKIFGIDNLSGKQHWVKYLPSFTNFKNDGKMQLIIQRTSRHFPYAAQCAVVGRERNTGNGLVYQFNPITGVPINGGIIQLGFQIQQLSLLQEHSVNFLRGIVFLDQTDKAHVIPESSAEQAHGFYLYTANVNSGVLTGYFLDFSDKKVLKSVPTWKVNLGGAGNLQKIIKISSKNPIEHVHSRGRVLSDRSVLYKYHNPNLVVVATHGPDSVHKCKFFFLLYKFIWLSLI